MRARNLARAAAATLLTGLFLLAASAPEAAADPYGYGGGCGCGHGYRTRYGRVGRCGGRSAYRHCLERVHEARFLARGQGWQLLRRHLHRIRIEPTHVHPRTYFQRRWPCRDSGRGWGGLECVGHDYPLTECSLVSAALEGDGEGQEAARDLEPADRLDRGMERFFRGAWEEAEQDFDVVARHDPEDARPRYGLLVCRVMQKDWKGAVAEMRTLEALDALDGHDRLEMDGTFQDPDTFKSFQQGLFDLTRWSFHDVDVQVVAGWTCAATGDEEGARRHWKAALRFAPGHDVATHLLATLEDEETTRPQPTPTSPAPVREPADNVAARDR